MKTLVVNLLGAAGSGKSTLAANIFATLKLKGYNCEYVSEYAKQIVYEENFKKLNNQLLVFANQYYNLDVLRDKIDIIITDSPILLSVFYNSNFNKKNTNKIPNNLFERLTMYCYSNFDNLNFFIKRNHEYKKEGRYQTEEQAKIEEGQILEVMKNLNIPVQTLYSTDNCVSKIVENIEKRCDYYKDMLKSGKEIERKFIVKNLPTDLDKAKKEYILQGYLDTKQGETRIRNVNNRKFFINEKYGQGIQRDEYEKEITKNDFLDLFKKTNSKIIKKVRYYYPLQNNKIAELDCYFGKLKGLNTVEVEFESMEEAENFNIPLWFGKEVTYDKKFKNHDLSNLETIDEIEM